MGLKISKTDKANQDNHIFHCQKYAGFARLGLQQSIADATFQPKAARMTWIFFRITKGQRSHKTTHGSNPKRAHPHPTRLFCLCWPKLPRKMDILPPPSHKEEQPFLKHYCTCYTICCNLQAEINSETEPINCVHRQCEVLFPIRKPGISCLKYIIFFCNSDTDVLNCSTSLNAQILHNQLNCGYESSNFLFQ